eukprot:gene20335-biopygen14624
MDGGASSHSSGDPLRQYLLSGDRISLLPPPTPPRCGRCLRRRPTYASRRSALRLRRTCGRDWMPGTPWKIVLWGIVFCKRSFPVGFEMPKPSWEKRWFDPPEIPEKSGGNRREFMKTLQGS